jgi:hypothetical protein
MSAVLMDIKLLIKVTNIINQYIKTVCDVAVCSAAATNRLGWFVRLCIKWMRSLDPTTVYHYNRTVL